MLIALEATKNGLSALFRNRLFWHDRDMDINRAVHPFARGVLLEAAGVFVDFVA